MRQVLVVLDTASHNLALLESAVSLAVRLEAQLQGLFVEDTDLLSVADLPCTREVVLSSARERPVSAGEMVRALRALAARAREDLARAAEQAQVQWSFRTVRGRRVPSIMDAGVGSDVLIVGRVRRIGWQVASGSRARRHGGGVYVIYTGSAAAERGLAAAAEMVYQDRRELVVFVCEADPQRAAALRTQVLAKLQAQHLRARVQGCAPSGNLTDLAEALEYAPSEVLILPEDMPLARDSTLFQGLLDRVHCSVVLVR